MSDVQTEPQTQAPPAPQAQPAVQSQPSATPNKGQGRPNGNGKKGKPKVQMIQMPAAAFKPRIDREARAIAMRELGMPLEEAIAKLKASVQVSAPTQPEQAAKSDDQSTKYQAELERLRKQYAQAQKAARDWENKYRKDTTKLRGKYTDLELKLIATKAGIGNTRYALSLFAEHVSNGGEANPESFFDGLRTSEPQLFKQAVPVSVAPTTAPPESQQPGEVTPSPTNPGANAPVIDAEKMSAQEFSRHVRGYGFTPGM